MFGLIVIGGAGASFLGNLLAMVSCCVVAFCVGPTATAIHRLQGAKRIVANVLMTLTGMAIVAMTSAPHLVNVAKQIVQDCAIFWWDILCWI